MSKSGGVFQIDDVTRTMSKSGGVFQIDDVTRTMSKSGGVFQIDDVTRTMSKGGGGACECLHPPLQEILYPRLVFHPSKFRPPPPPPPGWLVTGLLAFICHCSRVGGE